MDVQLPPTASNLEVFWLEVVWTVVTYVGVVYATKNCWDAWCDLQALRSSGRDGILSMTAKGELNDQAMIWTALFSDFVAGILALFSLPALNLQGGPTLLAAYGPPLFTIGALALIYASFSRQRRRRSIVRALRLPGPEKRSGR